MEKFKASVSENIGDIGCEHLSHLIQEAYFLKQEKERIELKLKNLHENIITFANFSEGKKTVTLPCQLALTAKVSIRENLKWSQEKLSRLKSILGESQFSKLFKTEYKHNSKQVLDNFIDYAPKKFKEPLLNSFTIQTSYSVSIEKI